MIAAQAKGRSKALKAKKAKAAPKGKLVDINSATKEELLKLPGVTETLAAQIIAKRPFPTKAHLVLQEALPHAVYTSIKDLIAARQPK